MDSDDDFLIEDDEDFDSGTKDELFDIVKQEKAASGAASASSVPTTPSKATNSSNASSSPAKPAQNGSPAPHGQLQDGSNGAAPGAQRQATPSLVVAPKPLTTPVASEESRSSQNQAANGAATGGDVLKGLQEGGNALWKKLGDFFQSPGAYIPAVANVATGPRSAASLAQESEDFFFATYNKFLETLASADSMTFPVLDDFINDFNGQESLRFDGSDLIEKQERDYFGLRERRIAKLEALIAEGKDASDVSDEEANAGIREQEVSRDQAVSDGEYQTGLLREHQSTRGQMFQNIVFCSSVLFKKLLLWEGATEREASLIPECIEEYLIPHVQKKLYCPDRWTDWRFAQLVGSSQFLQPRDLEVATPIDANLINRCGALLTEVNFLPTPRKKLQVIAQACRYIVNYLSEHPLNIAAAKAAAAPSTPETPDQTSTDPVPSFQSLHSATAPSTVPATPPPTPAEGDASTPSTVPAGSPSSQTTSPAAPSAAPASATTASPPLSHTKTDEFLAALIYILIQTNPPNLLSNVAYLVTCRSSSDSMLSDEGYFFAHVAIAVHFLCKLKETKSASKVNLEGGVILHEPEWMPMVLDKEARLLHLLPSINSARSSNDILEYKSTIRRLVLEIMRKNDRRNQDKAALEALIAQHQPIAYTPEQVAQFQKEPTAFFADHRYWNSSVEDFKTPSSVAHLLSEYKKLLMNEYLRQKPSTGTQ